MYGSSTSSRHHAHQNNAQRKQMHYSPNLLSTLNNAIENQLVAAIEYDSREKGVTQRDIEPMAVVFKDGKRNLVAYCRLREEYRSFRLDRLNIVKVKHDTFEIRPDFDIDQYQDAPGNQIEDYPAEDDY